MSSWICERCEREAMVSFLCDNCHRHVCQKCIVFSNNEDKQLCIDCSNPTEGVEIDEPEFVPA